MPGEAVLVGLAEVDDLDVGQGPAAVGAEHVVVGQPAAGSRATRPGCPSQPTTGANARIAVQISSAGRSTPQTGCLGKIRPSRRRRTQTTRGTARIAPGRSLGGRWTKRFVRPGQRELPLQALDLQERQAQGQQHRRRRDQAVDPVGPAPRPRNARGKPAGDQPDQERHRGPPPPPSSRRTPGPAAPRPAPASARASARAGLPERQGRRRPEQEARACRSPRCGRRRRPGA